MDSGILEACAQTMVPELSPQLEAGTHVGVRDASPKTIVNAEQRLSKEGFGPEVNSYTGLCLYLR